jgi:hypothetical protein
VGVGGHSINKRPLQAILAIFGRFQTTHFNLYVVVILAFQPLYIVVKKTAK